MLFARGCSVHVQYYYNINERIYREFIIMQSRIKSGRAVVPRVVPSGIALGPVAPRVLHTPTHIRTIIIIYYYYYVHVYHLYIILYNNGDVKIRPRIILLYHINSIVVDYAANISPVRRRRLL